MRSFCDEIKDIELFSKNYKSILATEQEIQKLSDKEIILYATGLNGVRVIDFLKNYGISVACFCDTHKTGIQKETGLRIITPKELLNEHNDSVIFISTIYIDSIRKSLIELGVAPKRIYSNFFFNARTEMTRSENIQIHYNGYERTYNSLNDDKSKRVLLERIKCHLIESDIIFPYVSPVVSPLEEQYFDYDIIKLSDKEVFVDCGMFTGDTAELFFRKANNKYSHYYGFEPDMENFEMAHTFLTDKPNVTIEPKGLFSVETTLSFNKNECLLGCSTICESGETSIEVISLDKYFAAKPHAPTFIKMDIEGSELDALKGCEHIIRQHKPKLAISIYHKPEDIYTLPDIIKSFQEDYIFYMRHYTNGINETVLYAV